MPNSEALSQEPKSPENLTEKMVYQGLGDFSNEFELSKEKLEISYPEGKNAKSVFAEISKLIEEGKKEGANTDETPENSLSPSEKIAAKIAEIKKSEIKDYRVEAFANCALKVFESEGNDQDSKNKVLEKLTNAFGFLGDEKTKEEGKETDKQTNEIDQFTEAFNKINADQQIEDGLKQALVGSFRDAFMKKKEPEPNKENSIESENIGSETTNSQDEEKAKTKDKTKDNPKEHFLDNYNVNYQSAGAAAAKLSIAVALCFVAPPIGFLLSAGFCAATPSWGQNAITKKEDREIGNSFLGKEATEKQEKEQEPKAIKKALGETIEKVVKGKEIAAEPTLEPGKVENTNETAASTTNEAAATTENQAVENTENQPPANTNLTTQDPPIEIGSIDLKLDDIDPAKEGETTRLTDTSSGTTHAESTNATNSLSRELSSRLVNIKNSLINFFNKDKTSDLTQMTHNPLLNDIDENSTSQNNGENLVIVGDSKEEEDRTFKNRWFLEPEAGKSEKLSSATFVEGENNSKKEEGKSSLLARLSDITKSLSDSISFTPGKSSDYSVAPPITPSAKNSSPNNQENGRGNSF